MRLQASIAGGAGALALAVALSSCAASKPSTAAANHPTSQTPSSADIESARGHDPAAYRFSLAHGARIVPDSRAGTFVVESSAPARPQALVVVVHGHNGTAFTHYRQWQPYAAAHGLGLVSVEWQTHWGKDAVFLDSPSTYGLIRRAVAREGTPPGRVLLHGFSQGSHEAFDLTSLDRRGARLFALTIAESGGVHGGPARDPALARTKWVVYCAGRDPWPQLSGCPAMRRARQYLQASGAVVERFMVDPPARHGGFLKNRPDVELALRAFAAALAHP
jgi:predicted esterase